MILLSLNTSLKKILYSNLPTITSDDYQKYLNEAENGYITIRKHPEDEKLVILNYTEQTTYEKRWNHETMTARGLILDISELNNDKVYILAKPFDKFFNMSENPEYEKDIDFSEQPIVMEKLDGSLGISYFFNNEIRFATRGNFNSDQAIKATEIWRKKYADKFNLIGYLGFPYTLLTEIIYPENRVVVDYGKTEDLFLIGFIDLTLMTDAPIEQVKNMAERYNMPMVKQYKLTIDKLLEMKKSLSANEEGWVLRFSNDKRLKIKGDEYLKIHQVMYGLSDKMKFKVWAEGNTKDLIMVLPEEFRDEIEKYFQRLEEIKISLRTVLTNLYKMAFEKTASRKEFAILVNEKVDESYRHLMFTAYNNNGEIPDEKLREYIYRNYRYYLSLDKNLRDEE